MIVKCNICGTENEVTGEVGNACCSTCLVPLKQFLCGNGRDGSGPQIIQNIKAIGTRDYDECWPTGACDTIFYKEDFNVVCFNLELDNSSLIALSKVRSGFRIYDSMNNIMLEDECDFDWERGYDRIARTWIIKGKDGSEVDDGEYRAEFFVENSPEKSVYFTVMSKESEAAKSVDDIQQRMINGVCIFCGGQFKKGLFGQKCSICGSKKNY